MYRPSHNYFRTDLLVVPDIVIGDSEQYFWVKDPNSEETLKLTKQELYLCHLMDGKLSSMAIIKKFEQKFKCELEISDFEAFSSVINNAGFLALYPQESVEEHLTATELVETCETTDVNYYDATNTINHPAINSPVRSRRARNPYQFFLLNPNQFFSYCAAKFKLPIGLIQIFLLATTTLSLLILIFHFSQFFSDLILAISSLPIYIGLPLSLVMVNLTTRLTQGTVIRSYGAIVDELGVEMWFGFFPQFYISREGIKYLDRSSKLWIFAAPLLFRLTLCNLSLLVWIVIRDSQSFLVTLSLIVFLSSFFGLLVDGCPVWKDNGYWWLTTYFRNTSLFDRGMQLANMIISRRPLPKGLSQAEKFGLLVYAGISILTSTAIFVIAAYLVYSYLEAILQGTGVLIAAIILALPIRWYFTMYPLGNNSGNGSRTTDQSRVTAERSSKQNGSPASAKPSSINKFVKKHKYTLIGIAGLALICALPYRYRPGGSLVLLPPIQTDIQANISGRITKVFVEGGDGKWLKKGTLLAQIDPSNQLHYSTPILDDIPKQESEIRQYKAALEKAKFDLNKLLNTPTTEEVEVSKAQLREAEQDLIVSRQQLNTTLQNLGVVQQELKTQLTQTEYKNREAERQNELYKSGAISLQDYENAQRQADIDESQVIELRQQIESSLQKVAEAREQVKKSEKNVETKQADLNEVLAGPHPDEIAAARQAVNEADAKVKTAEIGLGTTQKQLKVADIVMPYDGLITTSYLAQKEGTYIDQGGTFAVAEDPRNIRSQLTLAQTDVPSFTVGKPVEVKLSAYPNEPVVGHVTSIEPATTDQNDSQYVNIIVTLPNEKRLLKSGMSGHAKVDGPVVPVIVAYTRPWVRFFLIEVWSWFP